MYTCNDIGIYNYHDEHLLYCMQAESILAGLG